MLARIALAAVLGCAAAPALAQEREWIFDTGEEDAYLVFGVPESDDAGVSFGCTLRSGYIRIFIPEAGEDLKPGDRIKLTITVTGSDFTYDASTTANEMSATTSAEAVIAADDSLFAALRSADRFNIRAGKEENAFPLQGADIEGLVRACAKS